jgi:hypothetical protein
MTNEITNLTDRFESEIALYGITEVFVFAGEVYITSDFDLPFELVEEIEEAV